MFSADTSTPNTFSPFLCPIANTDSAAALSNLGGLQERTYGLVLQSFAVGQSNLLWTEGWDSVLVTSATGGAPLSHLPLLKLYQC